METMICSRRNRGRVNGHDECGYGCCRVMPKGKKSRRYYKRRERQAWRAEL
jgi:hypothetical protein